MFRRELRHIRRQDVKAKTEKVEIIALPKLINAVTDEIKRNELRKFVGALRDHNENIKTLSDEGFTSLLEKNLALYAKAETSDEKRCISVILSNIASIFGQKVDLANNEALLEVLEAESVVTESQSNMAVINTLSLVISVDASQIKAKNKDKIIEFIQNCLRKNDEFYPTDHRVSMKMIAVGCINRLYPYEGQSEAVVPSEIVKTILFTLKGEDKSEELVQNIMKVGYEILKSMIKSDSRHVNAPVVKALARYIAAFTNDEATKNVNKGIRHQTPEANQ